MLTDILLAVDGSDAAAAAIDAVQRLATGSSARVLVVTVSDRGDLLRTVQRPDSLTLQWETPPVAQRVVDEAVDAVRAAGLAARGCVYAQLDTVAQELVDIARAEGSGLMVLGTRGRGRLSGPLLGSVAHRVVHLAECPVLVAPKRTVPAGRRVARLLLAVDGSAGSRRALAVAADAAALGGAEIVVVHVCERRGQPWRRISPAGISVEHDAPQTAADLVDEMVLALQARGASAMAAVQAATGDVADDILTAAAQHDADTIVVGSRGRGAVPALLLGSTTCRLLHTASLPVLVAR